MDQLKADASLEALIVLLFQVHVVLVQQQSILNLLHLCLVPRVHHASQLELEVGHDLLYIGVVWVDLLKLRPELGLFGSSWQSVDRDQVALYLENLELSHRNLDVLNLEVINLSLDFTPEELLV